MRIPGLGTGLPFVHLPLSGIVPPTPILWETWNQNNWEGMNANWETYL